MNDPFLTRDWAERHHQFTSPLHAALERLADVVRVSLARVYRYEFDAPWQRDERRVRAGKLARLRRVDLV